MNNSYRNDYTLTNANASYYANNATGATITLANNATPDGYAYKVAVLNNAANSKTGINFTITGLDADGKPQSEVLAGPDASSTVYSVGYYSRVNSITLSATLGVDTVDIGTSGFFASKTYPLTSCKTATIDLYLNSGSINFTGQVSYNEVSTTEPPYNWDNATGQGQDFYQQTTSGNTFFLSPPSAFRVITDSFTSADFTLSIINNFARG